MSGDQNIAALLAKFGSATTTSTNSTSEVKSTTLQSSQLDPAISSIKSSAKTVEDPLDTLVLSNFSQQELNSPSNIVQPSSTGTTQPVPLSAAEQIIARIADLQKQLQEQSPGYEFLLHEIHVALAKDENILTLLSEEQIGIIVAGLSRKKNIVIAEQVATGKGRKKAVSVDDI